MPRHNRSWLVVPMSKPGQFAQSAPCKADVIVLDLAEFVRDRDRPAAREQARSVISTAIATGAQVFAQISPQALDADLAACVWPGLTGVVVSRAESAAQISAADEKLGELEATRALSPGAIEIVAAVETARGNSDAYDIARASRRVSGITLGRADLVMDLRAEPSNEFHLMQYLMQRLIIIARAAGVMPIGAWWRAPDRGLLATPTNTYEAARRGRAIGFKGAMCLRADQVEPVNRAYS